MAILPTQLSRVSNLLRGSVTEQSLARTQADLLTVENQLSTGQQVNVPSDNPSSAAIILELRKTLDLRTTYSSNIDQAKSQLGEVDSTLGDLTNLLQQAQTIASANVGSDVSADQRAGAAAVVDTLYNQALSIANKQFNGTYLFGGDSAAKAPFSQVNGGVQFVGSSTVLRNQVGDDASLAFQVSGASVFGALSTQTFGSNALAPSLTAQTRLSDLGGALGHGVSLGSIVLGNGSVTKTIDLSHADSIGDVVNAINAAGVGGVTASIGAGGGGGLALSGNATDNITLTDIAGGTTAADLGIVRATGGGAGAPLDGSSLQAKLTPLTRLSDLRGGAGIDVASGLVITNGSASAALKFTSPPLPSPPTVEGLLNAINGSGANVLARINAAGNGIEIVNPTQGTSLTVGENGGTTATDLGVRSLTGSTLLSALNGGKGVRTVAGGDIRIAGAGGATFSVSLADATTVQDVIDKINAGAAASGGGATVVAALAANGNGITLTDTSGGAGKLSVSALNLSPAAGDLGLLKPSATTNTSITGADVSGASANGVFAALAKLRDSLKNNDQTGITDAGGELKAAQDNVVIIRGEAGATSQELAARATEISNQNVATNSLLSSLQDTDFTTAITKFQTLQTALQATLQSAGKTLHLSLMDFLA